MRPWYPPERLVCLILVVALHAAVLLVLWQHRMLPVSKSVATLFVNFVAPPAPEEKKEPVRQIPKARNIEKPQPRQLVAEAPVVAPTDHVAPAPPAKPEQVIKAPVVPLPAGPMTMATELSVVCPERAAPQYPAQSRRLREAGIVVLRVELGETGHVVEARVHSSSGHFRLDEAALGAVRTWRCTPATRDGQPVRAVALQPFNFILQGN